LFSARHRKSKLFCWAEEYLRRGGVMLRNRSRAVTGKQSLMTDHSSQPSPTQKRTRAVPSFFGSPRFRAFIAKGLSETEAIISPTSILDTLPFSPFGTHPFSYDAHGKKTTPKALAFLLLKRVLQNPEMERFSLVQSLEFKSLLYRPPQFL